MRLIYCCYSVGSWIDWQQSNTFCKRKKMLWKWYKEVQTKQNSSEPWTSILIDGEGSSTQKASQMTFSHFYFNSNFKNKKQKTKQRKFLLFSQRQPGVVKQSAIHSLWQTHRGKGVKRSYLLPIRIYQVQVQSVHLGIETKNCNSSSCCSFCSDLWFFFVFTFLLPQ